MAYDHKKSNRTLTDEQFSDGTTIDGTRIDQALQDSVEHFNEIPEGDASTRMTQQQFVFGYQPAMYTSMPDTKAASLAGHAADRFPAKYRTAKGTAAGTTLPWIPLKNNKYTAVTTNPSTSWATGAGRITTSDLQSSTPSIGFQNKWRYKGTKIREWGDGISGDITNEGAVEDADWADFWLSGQGTAGDHRKLANGYQYVWSHSWNFAEPCLLHDLMVYLRTDRRGVYLGYYSKPLAYAAQGPSGFKVNAAWSCKQLYVSICVDNPFASEDRSMNDNEVVIWNRRIDAASTQAASRYDIGASPTLTLAGFDMLPRIKYEPAGTGGDDFWGFNYRLSDMNIPIHRNARVRMAIAIPWYSEITSNPAGTPLTGEGNIRKGWADPRSTAQSDLTNIPIKAFWQNAVSATAVPADLPNCPLGAEPMGGMSINACLTTLEEIAK